MKRNIFHFSIPQVNPSEKLKSIREEINKFRKDVDYSVSSDGRDYVILSDKLKVCLRLRVWERSFDEYKRVEHGGEYYDSGYFFYEEGKSDRDPDTFKVKNEVVYSKIEERDFPRIMEIDDEEAEKIRQENLKSKKDKEQREDLEVIEVKKLESSNSEVVDRRRNREVELEKTDDKNLVVNQEVKNNLSRKGVGKYAIPFMVSGLFLYVVLVVAK